VLPRHATWLPGEEHKQMDGGPQQSGSGITRRGLIRGGLFAGLGAAGLTAASSAVIPGVAQASINIVGAGVDDGSTLWLQAQDSWRYCSRCSNLFYSAAGHGNACVVGQALHNIGSTNYSVPINGGVAGNSNEGTDSFIQGVWHWCNRCGCLVWAPGWCHDGNDHDASSSGPYYMLNGTWHSHSGYPLQAGWRYCSNCHVLYWGGTWSSSVCAYQVLLQSSDVKHAAGNTVYYLFM